MASSRSSEPAHTPHVSPAEMALPTTGASRAREQLRGATEATRLAHLTTLEHVLFGESVIDAPRLWMTDAPSVDHFLRLNGFDLDNPLDRGRLDDLLHEATEYLADVHNYRLPLAVEQPAGGVPELMLKAALPVASREQRCACMVLKTICILHHISGRELLFNTPISEAQLFESLSAKVFACIDEMRRLGIGVQEFAAGKKSRMSLATKLLAKRTNLATHIFDKLRFRVVVESRDDLVYGLLFLLQHLVPFNYVLPEQSENNILRSADLTRVLLLDDSIVARTWQRPTTQSRRRSHDNEFSAAAFRTINFVADIPLRIDEAAPDASPAIAFVQTEIQLLDAVTARRNEEGDSAHPLYKRRQRARVRTRLESAHK